MFRIAIFLIFLKCLLAQTSTSHCGMYQAQRTELDSSFVTIYWVNNEIAFVETYQSGLYRTEDGGQTWQNLLPLMANADKPQVNGLYGVASVQRSSLNTTWYFNGYGRAMWRSDDAGKTFKYFETKEIIHSIKPHPFIPTTLLGSSGSARCYNDTADGECTEQLLKSVDGGQTWTLELQYIAHNKYAWGYGPHDKTASMFALDWGDKDGLAYEKDDYDLRLSWSFDSKNWYVKLNNTVDFLEDWQENFMLAAQRLSPDHDMLKLWVSDDIGASFHSVVFPTELEQQFFTFLDHSENVVFMHVREWFGADFGHVYMSDSLGGKFALTVPYVSYRDGAVEFAQMRGIEGVYLVNQKLTEGWDDERVATQISRDKGATWQPIDISRVTDVDGSPLSCDHTVTPGGIKGCYLNLGLQSKLSHDTQYARGLFHSDDDAAGYAIAVGNVGPWFDPPFSRDEVQHATFLTTDAGWSWKRIRNGSHIAEFADQGELIVLADDVTATKTLQWSGDGGKTWQECQFTNEELLVSNIVTVPSNIGTEVLVFGTRTLFSQQSGAVVHVSFRQHERGCEQDDYEEWEVPPAGDCHLGAHTIYHRKIVGRECHAAVEVEPVRRVPCECTAHDYECDACFELVDGVCSLVGCVEEEAYAEPDDCSSFWLKSRGHRKIPGNRCAPDDPTFEPIRVACSKQSGGDSNSSAWLAVVIILLVLVAIVVGGVVAFKKHRGFEQFVRQLRIPGIRPARARIDTHSQFAADDSEDDLLNDDGGYD